MDGGQGVSGLRLGAEAGVDAFCGELMNRDDSLCRRSSQPRAPRSIGINGDQTSALVQKPASTRGCSSPPSVSPRMAWKSSAWAKFTSRTCAVVRVCVGGACNSAGVGTGRRMDAAGGMQGIAVGWEGRCRRSHLASGSSKDAAPLQGGRWQIILPITSTGTSQCPKTTPLTSTQTCGHESVSQGWEDVAAKGRGAGLSLPRLWWTARTEDRVLQHRAEFDPPDGQ